MAKANSLPLAPSQAWWLLATGVITVVPLTQYLPIGFGIGTALFLAWRAWLAWQERPLPPRWLLVLLTFTTCAAVLSQYRTLFGQNAGVALLMLFMALKQLEVRSARDGLTVIFLAYFLALAQFFWSQSIPAALATAVATLVATAAMAHLTDARRQPLAQLRQALGMLLQAIPLMLLMFVLFPRVQGPLWGLPNDARSAMTGLSDTMAPGSISQLSQSDAIAFRVRFESPEPNRQQLYWRGPVLSRFDGRAWRIAQTDAVRTLPYAVPGTGGIDYEITIEAHNKGWLFALEQPAEVPPGTLVTQEVELLARKPVITRMRYHLRSIPGLAIGTDATEAELGPMLFLPRGSNPRTRALAAEWRRQAASDAEIVDLAKTFFLRQRLIYTLSPPRLGDDTADEFLFDTKQGFCEHFANAFAVAMRAAGVPARVVTGYQGGEINPVDGYLTVRQYDAHAWTEVWLHDRGWIRVDPTAISAPSRVDIDLAAALPAGDPLPLLMRRNLGWLRDLRYRLDAVTNTWNQWVLGYNPDRQRELLQRLGMPSPDWQRMSAVLAVLSGLALLALTAWNLRQRPHADPAVRLWARACRRLARKGLTRRAEEGPLDYAERVGRTLPHKAVEFRLIAKTYAALRYGRPDRNTQQRLAMLRRLVASFAP